jgi:hypothetical protein
VSDYPTWTRVNAKRWETEEGQQHTLGWVPDVVAVRERGGWRVKFRTSAQAIAGFRTMGEVKDYVTATTQRSS